MNRCPRFMQSNVFYLSAIGLLALHLAIALINIRSVAAISIPQPTASDSQRDKIVASQFQKSSGLREDPPPMGSR